MERLAEQIVDWHNRHPLARRIGVGDVHTIGVVALPFVRANAQSGGFAEPVLTDAVSAFDELAGSPPVSRWTVASQRLMSLPAVWLRRLSRRPHAQWRAFSEKFLPGLGLGRIERFALAHGYAEAPATPEARPWRVIVIDEKLASARPGWPFELYLMSAGIDVGKARTRVLSGRGIPSQIIGRRLWDPLRAGAAAAAVAVALAGTAWLLWPHPPATPEVPLAEPASAASAASAPASAAAMPASAPLPEAASAPAESASAAAPEPDASAPAAASAPELGASDAPVPDIRPRLVERADGKLPPPLWAPKPAEGSGGAAAAKSDEKASGKSAEKAGGKAGETLPGKAAEKPGAQPEVIDPRLARMAVSPNRMAVALVGPAGSKADAEALLTKMKDSLKGVHSDPDALQADVIQTPEGWRATIWPFPSREQAQLINATLVARGLKTKAVNF